MDDSNCGRSRGLCDSRCRDRWRDSSLERFREKTMSWYVIYQGTGEISGPMTKERALVMAEEMEGLVFSEDIFSPKIVTTPEVEELLHELKGIREAKEIIRDGEYDAVGLVLKRAMEAISSLPREMPSTSRREVVTTPEVEDLLKGLRDLTKRGLFLDACRDCGGFDSDDRQLCQDAINVIFLLFSRAIVPPVTPKSTSVKG